MPEGTNRHRPHPLHLIGHPENVEGILIKQLLQSKSQNTEGNLKKNTINVNLMLIVYSIVFTWFITF